MFQERSLQSFASRIVGSEPLTTMFVAAILKRTDGGFDGSINCDDSKRVAQAGVQVFCESAKVRILGPCDRPVTIGFGLATNDPAFELFRKLPIADLGIDSLAMLELVGTMERQLRIRVPDEQLVGLQTVRQLLELVERRMLQPA